MRLRSWTGSTAIHFLKVCDNFGGWRGGFIYLLSAMNCYVPVLTAPIGSKSKFYGHQKQSHLEDYSFILFHKAQELSSNLPSMVKARFNSNFTKARYDCENIFLSRLSFSIVPEFTNSHFRRNSPLYHVQDLLSQIRGIPSVGISGDSSQKKFVRLLPSSIWNRYTDARPPQMNLEMNILRACNEKFFWLKFC